MAPWAGISRAALGRGRGFFMVLYIIPAAGVICINNEHSQPHLLVFVSIFFSSSSCRPSIFSSSSCLLLDPHRLLVLISTPSIASCLRARRLVYRAASLGARLSKDHRGSTKFCSDGNRHISINMINQYQDLPSYRHDLFMSLKRCSICVPGR